MSILRWRPVGDSGDSGRLGAADSHPSADDPTRNGTGSTSSSSSNANFGSGDIQMGATKVDRLGGGIVDGANFFTSSAAGDRGDEEDTATTTTRTDTEHGGGNRDGGDTVDGGGGGGGKQPECLEATGL